MRLSVKNKRDRLFFTQLFVPQASQSSYDRRAELDVRLAIPSAQSACGMEDFMKLLIVVDMQNDFVTGSLGTKEAQAIVENVVCKIKETPAEQIYVTQDTHPEQYLQTRRTASSGCTLHRGNEWTLPVPGSRAGAERKTGGCSEKNSEAHLWLHGVD